MAKSTDAADAIRRLAKQYELMVSAADTLEQIGSLENATEEAKKSLEQHQKARELEVSLLVDAKAETKKAKEAGIKLAEDAKVKADLIIHNATLEADRVASESKSQALKFQSDANANIEKALAGVESQILKLNAEKSDLDAVVIGLKVDVSALIAQSDEAENRLAKVQAAISKLISA